MGLFDNIGGGQLAGMLDEDTARQILDNLDDEQINQVIRMVVQEYVAPILIEMRQNAQTYESRQYVRSQYESLSEEEQDEKYHRAMAEVRAVAEKLRVRPSEGIDDLKHVLRNPWFHEALLLAFNGENVPDQWSRERKEFVTYTGRWMLMSLIPEAYTEEEARDLLNEIYDGEVDPDEVLNRDV